MIDRSVADCRGIACPHPVINTKRALQGVTSHIVVIEDREDHPALNEAIHSETNRSIVE